MSLIDRAKNILITPKTEWEVVAAETPDANAILMSYAMPMILIGAVAMFVGRGFIGIAGFSSIKFGIVYAVISIISGVVGLYISAAIVNALAPTFNSEKDMGRAMQLVAYSNTAAWVCAVFNVIPFLGLVTWIGALYGIYIMYLGMPHIMKTPQDKVVAYMVVSWLIGVVIAFAIVAVLTAVAVSVILGTAGIGGL